VIEKKKYYLWGFMCTGGAFVITRGRTREEAMIWAERNHGWCVPLCFLPVNAAKAYSKTHPFDWLHIAPQWLQTQRTIASIQEEP
jgi:hypothetical protein